MPQILVWEFFGPNFLDTSGLSKKTKQNYCIYRNSSVQINSRSDKILKEGKGCILNLGGNFLFH